MTQKTKELTDKQKKFCHEYLKDKNGMQAAIRAGYAEKGAGTRASELLNDIRVSSLVDTLSKETMKKIDFDKMDLIVMILKILKVNPADYMTKDNEFDVDKLRRDRPLIQGFESKYTRYGQEIKVKFIDKAAMMDRLTKLLGWNEPDKLDVSTDFSEIIKRVSDLDKQ